MEDTLHGLVELIPPSWQYPEVTCAKLVLDDEEFKTDNYEESEWKMKSNILVEGENRGFLEVAYLEERPESEEGPFLKEERNLIEAITERLSKIIRRLELEEEIRESEDKYRSLVENLNEVVYILDEDAKIEYVSPNVEEISGYSPSELAEKSFVELVHPDDVEGRIEQFKKVLSGEGEPSEYRFITKNGDARWVRTHARPILVEGRTVGVQGILTDITERNEMEEELRESEEKYRTHSGCEKNQN